MKRTRTSLLLSCSASLLACAVPGVPAPTLVPEPSSAVCTLPLDLTPNRDSNPPKVEIVPSLPQPCYSVERPLVIRIWAHDNKALRKVYAWLDVNRDSRIDPSETFQARRVVADLYEARIPVGATLKGEYVLTAVAEDTFDFSEFKKMSVEVFSCSGSAPANV